MSELQCSTCELSFYEVCAGARTMDELRADGGVHGLRPVYAQWAPDGRLLEVQFISTYSGKPAVHYRYDR